MVYESFEEGYHIDNLKNINIKHLKLFLLTSVFQYCIRKEVNLSYDIH